MTNLIFTSQDATQQLAVNEVKKFENKVKVEKWLDNGVAFCSTEDNFNDVVKEFRKTIFTRHIFRVHTVLTIDENFYENLNKTVLELTSDVEKSETVSVQARQVVKNDFEITKFDTIVKLSDLLKEQGYEISVKDPENIISIFLTRKECYIGVGTAWENLGSYNGGMVMFAKDEEQISRAEYKLLEAFEVFGIDLGNFRTAIDLGAAPGGWTKTLVESGLRVLAVDPAELDERLLENKNVVHHRLMAEDFISRYDVKVDVLVNDMKMDVIKTCEIMNTMADSLAHDGIGIVTFKLPQKNQTGKILDGLRILKEKYKVIYKKQLFNNRSEITVVVKKR